MSEVLEQQLNERFRATMRVLFGKEIGELPEYREYLLSEVHKPLTRKSHVSGKEVFFSREHYAEKARFADLAEIAADPREVDINDVKDLESLLRALNENLVYCGNNNIGMSMHVEKSDVCADSVFILNSHQLMSSKYVAYSHGIRAGENIFGSMWCGNNSFLVRCQGLFNCARGFESYLCVNARSTCFSFNCRNCSEMLFSFNQVSKKNAIGNLELAPEKYMALKQKLMGEVADALARKKQYPNLFELAGGVAP